MGQAEPLLQQASARFEVHDYAGALPLLRRALEMQPNDPEVIFNTGMAASLTGDHGLAIELFERFRKVAPDQPRGLVKLIQAYQGAGRDADAEHSIDDLRPLWKKGVLTGPMADERSFVRDQFTVGKYQVMAFELFQPDTAKREHTWDFCVLEQGKQVAMYYVMRDVMAERAGGPQLYYFDVRWQGGGGTLVGLALKRPTYAQAADVIKKALAGQKIDPIIKP